MLIVGRYSSWKCVFDRATITLHLRGGLSEQIAELYSMSGKALKVKLDTQYDFNGEIDGIHISDKHITVELVTTINKNTGKLPYLMSRDISIELTIDILGQKEKNVVRPFLRLVKELIKDVAKARGYTEEEFRTLAENAFSKDAGINFSVYYNRENHELEAFYAFLRIWATSIGMESIIKNSPNPGAYDGMLARNRANNECCLCKKPSVEVIDVYPLCFNHRKEVEILKKAHSKNWRKIFENKYHFDREVKI